MVLKELNGKLINGLERSQLMNSLERIQFKKDVTSSWAEMRKVGFVYLHCNAHIYTVKHVLQCISGAFTL